MQCPSLIIVSCSDSRCSVPLLFDRPYLGSTFEIKTAGNCIDTSCFESIKYAIEHIEPPPKLIIVMGHTACGAITACYNTLQHMDQAGLRTEYPYIMTRLLEPTL